MRDLKFKNIKASNILCFGEDGIEIKFSDFGNVVQMHGINLDAPGTDEFPASNGAGKSSIQELLSIGLFGRTVKNPTKNKGARIVNVLANKGQIEIEWDDFRLVRSFKKSKSGTVSSKLDLWQSQDSKWNDDTQITFGTSDETQKFISEKIGLSHHAFCNVVIFDDSNTYSFLEADAATKRQMVENLLDLEQYRDYFNNCKEIFKNIKKKIADLTKEYENIKIEIESCDKRIETINKQEANWKLNKQKEIKDLIVKIKEKQNELENSDVGSQMAQWQQSQERIEKLTDDITDIESKRDKVLKAIQTAREKLDVSREERMKLNESIQNYSLAINTVKEELSKSLKLIKGLENLDEGNACPTCHGIINKENYIHVINHGKEIIFNSEESIKNKEYKIEELRKSYGEKSSNITTIEEKIEEAESKVTILENNLKKNRAEISELSQVIKPEGSTFEKVIEAEIIELKKQAKSKKEEYEGLSPYVEIIEEAKKEKEEKENNKKQKIKDLEKAELELPYYEFWMEAFGDAGIRKFIIDNIIPALNEKVAYWLEILIDGLIEVTFNNQLEEKITRNGNEAFYHNMSKGEIRRINLAVSQSFSHIMMLNSGCCPSIVFLDEITGGGIDKAGVPYVYNMIFELAKERQVFVTTHNDILVNLLQGCESLTLKKHNDVTVVVR